MPESLTLDRIWSGEWEIFWVCCIQRVEIDYFSYDKRNNIVYVIQLSDIIEY